MTYPSCKCKISPATVDGGVFLHSFISEFYHHHFGTFWCRILVQDFATIRPSTVTYGRPLKLWPISSKEESTNTAPGSPKMWATKVGGSCYNSGSSAKNMERIMGILYDIIGYDSRKSQPQTWCLGLSKNALYTPIYWVCTGKTYHKPWDVGGFRNFQTNPAGFSIV